LGWSDEFRFRNCPWCGVRDAQLHLQAGPVMARRADYRERWWTLLTCPRCAGPIVVETNHANEAPHRELSTFPVEERVTVAVAHLPDDVEAYYGDALRVLDAGVPDAAAVQLRRTLEAAAAHLGIKESSLVKSIEEMIAQQLITAQFGEVLHHVRKVGNLGAHATDERIDDTTAQQVLKFTMQVLRNLFEIPAELDQLGGSSDEA